MANLAVRSVLIYVVPVVILLSLYLFKKKKKKYNASPLNPNTSLQESNQGLDSQNSIYSHAESASDFSNTLSDASSISSPENSIKNENVCETHKDDTNHDTVIKDVLLVTNHVDHLSFSKFHTNGKQVSNCNTQINQAENMILPVDEAMDIGSLESITQSKGNVQLKLQETFDNSLHTSGVDVENFMSGNEKITVATDCNSEFSNGIHTDVLTNSLIEEKDKQNSESENSSFDNIIKKSVISEIESNFFNMHTDQNTNNHLISDPFKLSEADSHSSVLDENSLSSMSDESDRQTDFKCKDSLSSVFGGNSISDESEKTDISNEHITVSKPKDNCIDNEEPLVSNVSVEKYSIQLNKNSFFTNTSSGIEESKICSNLNEDLSNNFTADLHSCESFVPSSSQSSSKLCFDNTDDSNITIENSNQHTLSQDVSSCKDILNFSSPEVSYNEVISSTSEEVISSTLLLTSCNQTDRQSETAISLFSCDTTVSSSTDTIPISQKDASKVDNSEQLDSIFPVQNNSSDTINIKAQDNQLESLSQCKVTELDMADLKSSIMINGLFVYEFDLPQELCGRLIGKQGKHVKSIKERTNANVFIKRHPFDTNLKTVVVEGGRTAVQEALEIIRRKFPPSQFPTLTLAQTNMMNTPGVSLPDSLQLHLPEGASCDVILSSLLSADHFFLQQPTHPTYPSLGTLDQIMINCYSQMDTPLLPHPVEAGVICAAPVMNGWYRAQVIYVFENRNECEVKFVDYGGFSQVPTSSLRQIRSDFMTLPFQASECYLANVRPVDCNAGWSSEVTSVFEELAQGQILQALLVEYAEDGIPCVHLYRVQGISSMFINRELVERGLAVWVNNSHWDPH